MYTLYVHACACVCMYVPAGKVGKGRMNEVKPVDVNLQWQCVLMELVILVCQEGG